jgi:lysyl-tRNA synthetase class 2
MAHKQRVGCLTDPWWTPSRHQDRRARLLARNRVKSALRAHFEGQGFIEVEAAALQVSPGNETHLHAFATNAVSPDGQARPLYLHTSPEFALKKVLAAGERKIFDFARVFRNRESGVRHAQEFVMLEWYRVEEDYTALMDDCEAILTVATGAAGATMLRHGNRTADPFEAPERLTVADAFTRHAGIDLLATLDDAGGARREPLAAAAVAAGVRVAADDSWSDIFSRVMAERIEPAIGNGRVTILCDYPLPEAALARPKPGQPKVAERFEMFACGLELANAFGELRDASEQRRRFEADMEEKARLYGERYPIDEDFLAALPLMPEASGSALGFDRLVMLLLGAPRIEDIQWTPAAEPA